MHVVAAPGAGVRGCGGVVGGVGEAARSADAGGVQRSDQKVLLLHPPSQRLDGDSVGGFGKGVTQWGGSAERMARPAPSPSLSRTGKGCGHRAW